MAISPAVISKGTSSVIKHRIDFTYFDPNALTHHLYRSTSPMLGDPIANGIRIQKHVNPNGPLFDTTLEVGNTYYYAIVSSNETDYEIDFRNMLETEGLGHIYDNAVIYLHAKHSDHITEQVNGDTVITTIKSIDPMNRERAQAAAIKPIIEGNFFRIERSAETGSYISQPIKPNHTSIVYWRFWLKLDYQASEAGDYIGNQNLIQMQNSSNDGVSIYLDSGRPRPDIEFSDGRYFVQRTSPLMRTGTWDLSEFFYNPADGQMRWIKSRFGTYGNVTVRSSNRPIGTTIVGINNPSMDYRVRIGNHSSGGDVGKPFLFGGIYYSEVIPSLEDREKWFNLEKASYGYV